MDLRIRAIVVNVLHALAEMRHGKREFALFVTVRDGVEVKA